MERIIDGKAHLKVAKNKKKSQLIVSKILKRMLIVDDFVKDWILVPFMVN